MRRSDRLFQIIQILRSASRNPITAQDISEELETSTRTIYRDIADLMAQKVPIRGEAGIGYILESGYDFPPLMLTESEVEAALLGAQWVANQGDNDLATGARDLIAKIGEVIPKEMQAIVLEPVTMTPKIAPLESDNIDMQQLRNAIRQRNKIDITYKDVDQNVSERLIWPIAVAYFQTVRLIIAWCEKREDFRNFRTDRIANWQISDEIFSTSVSELRKNWYKKERCRM